MKTHVIFAKTTSRDRAQAAVYAHRHRLAGEPAAAPDGVGSWPG